jgi:hypothetical protein
MRDDGMTDDRDDSPIDYSSLGPPISSARFDALVANVGRAAQPELERRREQYREQSREHRGLMRVVVAWRKPLMVASGLAAAAGFAVMLRTSPVTAVIVASRDVGTIASDTLTVSTALGIPAEFTSSVEGSTVTTPEQK